MVGELRAFGMFIVFGLGVTGFRVSLLAKGQGVQGLGRFAAMASIGVPSVMCVCVHIGCVGHYAAGFVVCMYVCVYVCLHVCVYEFFCMYVGMHVTYACMYVCMYM